MALKLKSTNELHQATHATVFCYGPNGSGKTHFAATWPNPLFIVPEMSTNELITVCDKDISFVTFKDIAELKSVVVDLVEAKQKKKLNFDTIVVDNLTTIQMLLEEEIKADIKSDKLTTPAWGRFTGIFTYLLTRLHSLDKHIIWIAHVDLDRKVWAMKGDAKNFIPGNCDLILYAETVSQGSTKPLLYKMHLTQKGDLVARVRRSLTEAKEVGPLKTLNNPSYEALLNYIEI